MDQAILIQESFNAICINMDLKDYEEASVIAGYLAAFHESFTPSQLDQLQLTLYRLEHLAGQLDDNETD